MTLVSEIEIAVKKLSRDELSAFRDWFQEFDAEAWDKQFEADAAAGRLDALAEEALRDLHEGRCTDLLDIELTQNSGDFMLNCLKTFSDLPKRITRY